MSKKTLHETLIAFEEARKLMKSDENQVTAGVIMAVGILLGGGYPGCAAAITEMVETTYPADEDWPWGPALNPPIKRRTP
jgi:hypothetical protein